MPDRNRSSKQKTPVVKRTVNPVWNYTFVYDDVSLSELSERALELTIWDHDRLASNEFLGGVRFSLGTGKSFLSFFLQQKLNFNFVKANIMEKLLIGWIQRVKNFHCGKVCSIDPIFG